MLAAFGIGFVIGVVAVIWFLRLTVREEPTACLIIFGILFSLIFSTLVIVTRLILAE